MLSHKRRNSIPHICTEDILDLRIVHITDFTKYEKSSIQHNSLELQQHFM